MKDKRKGNEPDFGPVKNRKTNKTPGDPRPSTIKPLTIYPEYPLHTLPTNLPDNINTHSNP
jgi:hypothetical protein